MSTTISMTTPDQGLIGDVLCQLDRDPRVDRSRIQVECVDRLVTLTGSVAWGYQKLAAEFDARAMGSVRAVDNRIVVQSAILPRDVLDRIVSASSAHGGVDPSHIRVDVAGRVVTLIGSVNSWVARGIAERAAWRTPGVSEVRNMIEIDHER